MSDAVASSILNSFEPSKLAATSILDAKEDRSWDPTNVYLVVDEGGGAMGVPEPTRSLWGYFRDLQDIMWLWQVLKMPKEKTG